MSVPAFDSPNWKERLQAVQELSHHRIDAAEVRLSLLKLLGDAEFSVAHEAAKAIALLGDRSLLPHLIRERQAVVRELSSNGLECKYDASEGWREAVLTKAIVSLLTPLECEKLSTRGTDYEKWLIRKKQGMTSINGLWEPMMG